jgi:hypothetical protein
MRILMVEPGKEPFVTEVSNDLESLQKAVDGLIEVMCLEENVLIVCNEDGKCMGLNGNRRVDNGDIIAGAFLICGSNDEGEMLSLTDEQIKKYTERFKEPEFYTAVEVEDAIFLEVYAQDDEDEMEV